MITSPENTTPTDTMEQEDVKPSSTRRFPAIQQLAILSALLFVLLGSAGLAYFDHKNDLADNAWVEVNASDSQRPSASLTTTAIKPLEEIQIEAQAGFVYDIATNRVLYQKDADATLPIASITKLMTTLVAHELLSDDATITIPHTATLVESASGLQDGERLSVRALTNYAMLASSNDAAQSLAKAGALAISTDASEAVFVEAMNIRAKELGFSTLNFKNAHGLDIDTETAGAYGSARDITFLMKYIYERYPGLLSITMDDNARIYNEAGQFHDATNTNRALSEIPQLRGSKTGYTILSGGNLTVVFDAGLNRPIIVTVLGSSFSGRFTDVLSLIEATKASLSETPQ